MKIRLEELTHRIMAGGEISFEEASCLARENGINSILALVAAAHRVRQTFLGNRMDLCSVVNAKSGDCPEDCAFCAQSSHYPTDCSSYPLLSADAMVAAAKDSERIGTQRFCIVTSGKKVNDRELDTITEALSRIRQETQLDLDCSLGCLSPSHLDELKKAGMTRYNHNLETARSHFPSIISTHAYEDRVNTIKLLKEAGIETCCGGIIGLGETAEQRLELAFALRDLDVDCIPLNILNPRPGTPLAIAEPLRPLEVVKTLALFRLILPDKTIKLAGGREANLRDLQSLALLAGVNGLIIGGYLTTQGRSAENDMQMLKDLEFIC